MASPTTERTGTAGVMSLPEHRAVQQVQAIPPAAVAGAASYSELQRLVDLAANCHMQTMPSGSAASQMVNGSMSGLRATQEIHRMVIRQQAPSEGRMKSCVVLGQSSGRLDFELSFIDPNAVPRPDRDTAAVPWNRSAAARFVIRRAEIRFDSGSALQMFGTGMVYPLFAGGQLRQMAGAVCAIRSGTGVFAGLEGSCTWCGDLSGDGFSGHLLTRIRDPRAQVVEGQALSPMGEMKDLESGLSYLSWIGQKTKEARLDNSASVSPQGVLRGLNIPVDLKVVETGWEDSASGFRAAALRVGEVIGAEIGFGKESKPRTTENGNANSPFQFEGVSRYRFFDRQGSDVGTFTANVLEGRSIMVKLEGAAEQPALTFGFFGPVMHGTGCFAGLRGMLYGASGSVFNPPPLDHVISNWYTLRLYDQDGRYRCSVGEAR